MTDAAAHPAPDERQKAKLSQFLADLLRVGCVRGFKNFNMYMRGREELIITVTNEPTLHTPLASPASSFGGLQELPRNQQSLMLSGRTQRRLSGYGYINVGLPPASPSDREIIVPDERATVFLLAGYGRYSCPYVWVRSNHERLVRLSGSDQTEKDNPLKLKSTVAWATEDIRVWDVIAELVDICTLPAPSNPFSVDHAFFDALPRLESVVASGAMMYLLQRILLSGQHRFDHKVREDFKMVSERHFRDLKQLYQEQNGPAVAAGAGPAVNIIPA